MHYNIDNDLFGGMGEQEEKPKKKNNRKKKKSEENIKKKNIKSQEELICYICNLHNGYVNPATERCGVCDIYIFAGYSTGEAREMTRSKVGAQE